MWRSYFNIEKSAFRKSVYIGYSAGNVFHIRKGAVSGWVAQQLKPGSPDIDPAGERLFSPSLGGISRLLADRTARMKKEGMA